MLIGSEAFTPYQCARIRHLLTVSKANTFVTVLDAPQQNVAFTDTSLQKIYIDGARFSNAPIAFSNTLSHEIAHTKGAVHDPIFIPGSIMSYSVRLDAQGQAIEDDYLLTP
jgi:predicted double-glycine peptidase